MTAKTWKKQIENPDYNYLRLGSDLRDHVIFELTPDNDLNIFIGTRQNIRCLNHKVSKEGKILLKKWINENI